MGFNMLSKKAIAEYKQIYKEEYGEELTDKKAQEQTLRLLHLFRVIYKPIKIK